MPELLRRGVEIDIVTDQTSAHDPLAYLPIGVELGGLARLRGRQARRVHRPGAGDRWPRTWRRWSDSLDAGAEVFDYGNSHPRRGQLGGYQRAFDFPGFVPAYIRPLFCAGKGPFRWVALSGDPADIHATDRAVRELFPDDDSLQRWMRARAGADRLPGAAGADLLAGRGRAARWPGCGSTRWWRPGSCPRRW